MQFKKATREQIKLRMALDGPSGAGKTLTGLRLAFALAAIIPEDQRAKRPWRVSVIDSESGSAKKYVGDTWDGVTIDFDGVELAHFAPTEYTSAIEAAGAAGYDALLIDSLSHAWEGKDGALEQVSRKGGNSYTAWKDVTPQHRRMIDAIVNSPCHVFATMRSKTDYVLELNDKGKQEPRRVGMAPIQRSGMEYEFDIYGSLDLSHVMTITKSRCAAVDGAIVVKPGASFITPVIEWLQRGTPAGATATARLSAMIADAQIQRAAELVAQMGRKMDWLAAELPKRCGVTELTLVTAEQAGELMKWLEAQAKGHGKVKAAEQKRAEKAEKADQAERAVTGANGNGPASTGPAAPTVATSAPTVATSPTPLADATKLGGPVPADLPGKLDLIRDLFSQWKGYELAHLAAVAKPPPDLDLAVKKTWMMDILPAGISKLAELTEAKADAVILCLRMRIAHYETMGEMQDALEGKLEKGGTGAAAAKR